MKTNKQHSIKAQMIETGGSHEGNLKWGLNFYWGVLRGKNRSGWGGYFHGPLMHEKQFPLVTRFKICFSVNLQTFWTESPA